MRTEGFKGSLLFGASKRKVLSGCREISPQNRHLRAVIVIVIVVAVVGVGSYFRLKGGEGEDDQTITTVNGIGVSATTEQTQILSPKGWVPVIRTHVTIHNLTSDNALWVGYEFTYYLNNEFWDGGGGTYVTGVVIPAGTTKNLEYSRECTGIQGYVTIEGIVTVVVSGDNIEVPYSNEIIL